MPSVHEFLGFSDNFSRSAVILPTFEGERGKSRPPQMHLPEMLTSDDMQTLMHVEGNIAGYRYSTALGDLMAAQQLQRLCIDCNIRAPLLVGDRMEPFAWERPSRVSFSEAPEASGRIPEYAHNFVVGLASNSEFVKLFNSELHRVFHLQYLDLEARSGLILGLPDPLRPETTLYGMDGEPIHSVDSSAMGVTPTSRFILYARVRLGMNTYFLIGGDSEPETFFAGVFLRRYWEFIANLLPDAKPSCR